MKKKISLFCLFILCLILSGCKVTTTVKTTKVPTTNSITSSIQTSSKKSSNTSSKTSNKTTTTITTLKPTTTISKTFTTTITTTTTKTTTKPQELVTINFYAFNDLHGYINSYEPNLSKIAKYLVDVKENNKNTVILANGDMFQGTALSNYYYGLPILEVLNYLELDAFTIGNHEFDWGIDKIANYKDGNLTNGEADFPFLAANIVNKETKEQMSFTEPYAVIERDGVKIGIIGTIGKYESSIAASRVAGYEFVDQNETARKYARILREEKDCKIVILLTHSYDEDIFDNKQVAKFSGSERIDAIFNGHFHWNVSGMINDKNRQVPYVQIDSSNNFLSLITLVYDPMTEEVMPQFPQLIGKANFTKEDVYAKDIINTFNDDETYLNFINEEFLISSEYLYRDNMPKYLSSVIKYAAHTDFGMVNAGGVSKSIGRNHMLTMADLVLMYPYDNPIKTCLLYGEDIINLYLRAYNGYIDVVFDLDVSYSGGNLYIKGEKVDPNKKYSVGAVDYIFDKTIYPFLNGENILYTSMLMRDLMVEDLRLQRTSGITKFYPTNGPFASWN